MQQQTNIQTPNIRSLFPVLFAAGMLGVLAYALLLAGILPQIANLTGEGTPPPPLPILVGIVALQSGILLAVAVLSGLFLSKRMHFNPVPLLTDIEHHWGRVWLGLGSGAVVGFLTLIIAQYLILPILGIQLGLNIEGSIVLSLATAFLYGGITEELLMRLGLMTLLLWIAGKVRGDELGKPTTPAFWTVNIIVWVLFGLGHLPAAIGLMGATLSPQLIGWVIIANSVSLLFGWLYWRRGLESAIAAHMGFHIGYTVVGLLLGSQ